MDTADPRHLTSDRLAVALKSGFHRVIEEQDELNRINVFPVDVAPLRARRDDIPALVDFFLHKYAHENGRQVPRIEAKALRMLQMYSWPWSLTMRVRQAPPGRTSMVSITGVVPSGPHHFASSAGSDQASPRKT